ncbi:MAG: hypothetical protein CSB55_05120 [Candidatus Cloacimonadota bacterium]|nr:MAG: hypothetical protein CSB55_05120 [Candidatus Cloacimonadota bacterium]
MKYFFIALLISCSCLLTGFQNNEKLKFKIKYGMISAGYASMTIDTLVFRDSVDCYKISAKAETNGFFDKIFKVRDNITSIWDKEKKVSRQFSKKLREGSYRQKRDQYFYPEQNFSLYLKWDMKKHKMKEKKLEIIDNTQDILSAFYWTRQQELKVGESKFINVSADGKNYKAEVKVHRKETLDTIFGTKECFLIEPVLVGDAIFKQTGNIYIWITDDDLKVPVLMESEVVFGSFKAVLEEADNVSFE